MADKNVIKSRYFFEEDFEEQLAEVPSEKLASWDKDAKLKIVGKGVNRYDAYDKISGTARYTFDIDLPHMVYAKTLRCPHAHARIESIDTSRAEKMPGVLAVLTADNAPKIKWYRGISYLFDRHLRYAGDEVACVAAKSERIAAEAIEKIKVEYEVLPFVSNAAEAMKPNAPKLYENGNIAGNKPAVYKRGNVDEGFSQADVVVEETFDTQVVVHNPTEPHCSVVNWDGDKLTVWDSTQSIFGVRNAIADSLDIPANHVRVIKKYMGGGFGSKLAAGKYTVMAALLAKKIGRPVKIVLDREEMNLAVGNRPDSVQKLKFGVKKDGTLLAIKHYSYGAAGAYPSGAGCSWPLRTIYKCPNVHTEEYTVYINAGPGRPFRAPGHVQGTFALEAMIDMAAGKVGMDPLEFRLKNYSDTDPVSGLPYTTKRLREAYNTGAKAIGWDKRNPEPGSDSGVIKRGLGMASQIWWGGGVPPAYANLKMNRDGSVHILCGTQDLGTGTYTILAQVAAEVLQIPMGKVSVILGDTAVTPYAPGSGGSVTAPSTTPAVRHAAELMKEKLIRYASAQLNLPSERVVYHAGELYDRENPSQKVSISALMRKVREQVLLTTGMREANPDGYAVNTFGAQFAEVEVHTDTGKIVVKRIVAAHDIGRTLNRKLLENQFEGGIMQGIGFALMEQRVIDRNTGKVLTTNLENYKMTLMGDMPEIEVIIVSDADPLLNSTGVKGIGEPAHIPTAAAIANAVYNATGVRFKSLPLTPEKVLQGLYTKV